ncbi:hypothetical protein HYALB_00003421 [Hymenoscyphus albidus]|uniref:Dolichyl-diphosphooligosaccharide--protein glycosyltransferase subunit 4 n=1 Tax=Hymenoscyphus albidus TaxID=595503 RepID=A0A9N9PWI3_9HELO|nr:hypothetical protein HYALB_00003421 [Hymenoscyphus albidus]
MVLKWELAAAWRSWLRPGEAPSAQGKLASFASNRLIQPKPAKLNHRHFLRRLLYNNLPTPHFPQTTSTMISDDDLYRLAIVLGSIAMMLIVLYHFLEVNSDEGATEKARVARKDTKSGSIAR